ncbi:MAG TPA: phage portal protein [Hyphomicrobiaceae bacterium]|jgi:capsid protein|nr:phage portal protein [Hyphomicrobiaceae bacterium]
MLTRIVHATRAAVRTFRRQFDVAGGSGRWPASATLFAPVNQAQAAAGVARKRVAYLVENSPLAASIVHNFITAAVADGPSVRSNVRDPDERADLELRWDTFVRGCDIEGVVDLGGFLSRLVRGFMIDGEAFTHFAVDDDQLRLRLLSAEQIDQAMTRVGSMTTGTAPRIVQGIETDAAGRRAAYWVLPSQPDVVWASIGPPVRVPAMDVCHLYEPRFPGQLRGLSPLAAVATRLLEIDALEDAALKKAQVNALFTCRSRKSYPPGFAR